MSRRVTKSTSYRSVAPPNDRSEGSGSSDGDAHEHQPDLAEPPGPAASRLRQARTGSAASATSRGVTTRIPATGSTKNPSGSVPGYSGAEREEREVEPEVRRLQEVEPGPGTRPRQREVVGLVRVAERGELVAHPELGRRAEADDVVERQQQQAGRERGRDRGRGRREPAAPPGQVARGPAMRHHDQTRIGAARAMFAREPTARPERPGSRPPTSGQRRWRSRRAATTSSSTASIRKKSPAAIGGLVDRRAGAA